jgi:hypothetical protein
MSEEKRQLKLHLIVLVLVVLAEFIGTKSFKVGPGTVVTTAHVICPFAWTPDRAKVSQNH